MGKNRDSAENPARIRSGQGIENLARIRSGQEIENPARIKSAQEMGKHRMVLRFMLCGIATAFFLSGCGGNRAEDMALPVLAQPEELYAESEDAKSSEPTGESAAGAEDGNGAREEAGEDAFAETEEGESGAESEDSLEEQPDTVTITISAAGDCSLGNYQNQDYAYSFCQTYELQQNDSYFFENVYDIFAQDDLTIVNLEGVLTLSEQMNPGRTYNIKGDPSYTGILTAGSVEAVSMANNHRQDYGEQGTEDTVAALREAGIRYAYDGIVDIVEVKGIRIGIVSVNECSQGATVETFLKNGMEKLKEEGADLILACCHWGIEKDYYPEEYQKQLGRKCIDWGADLVIGHHPHVLQGIDVYQGKYIIYSLGNFCFGANRNPSDKDTMIFQQTFVFSEGEKQPETEAKVIPCSLSSVKERNDYKPTPAQGEEAARILERIKEFSRDFQVGIAQDGVLSIESGTQEFLENE